LRLVGLGDLLLRWVELLLLLLLRVELLLPLLWVELLLLLLRVNLLLKRLLLLLLLRVKLLLLLLLRVESLLLLMLSQLLLLVGYLLLQRGYLIRRLLLLLRELPIQMARRRSQTDPSPAPKAVVVVADRNLAVEVAAAVQSVAEHVAAAADCTTATVPRLRIADAEPTAAAAAVAANPKVTDIRWPGCHPTRLLPRPLRDWPGRIVPSEPAAAVEMYRKPAAAVAGTDHRPVVAAEAVVGIGRRGGLSSHSGVGVAAAEDIPDVAV